MTSRLRLRRDDGQTYLERWGIEHPRIGGVFVHRMTAPDPGLDLHDHPWSFWSLILKGGYVEERSDSMTAVARAQWPEMMMRRYGGEFRLRGNRSSRKPGTFRRFRIDEAHRIVELADGGSWSLVIHGPRRREWGFHTPDGWVVWNAYDRSRRGLGEDAL